MAEAADNASLSSVGGKDAGYLIEFNENGVFLTVYPEGDSTLLFEVADLQDILKEHKVDDYEMEALARALREKTGEPVQLVEIAPKQEPPAELEEAKIKIEVSRDKMTAVLSFEINENSKKPTREQVMQELNRLGIVFGINQVKIDQAVDSLQSGNEIVTGNPPENGQDAQIKKYYDLDNKGRPVQKENDRVDYKNLNLFVLVKAGDILAERIPHTMGITGTNIFGDTVAARPGKPKPLPNGKNTKIIDETIVAVMDGQVIETGKKITVDPVLSISGDVDMSTGNIDFNGSVRIKGSVQPGFRVCAVGDVEISGTVSGGTVEARSITVTGGIQGMSRGSLVAKEDIRASFAENADIRAEKNVYITDVVLHSEIHAGLKIVVEGRRGQITGGNMLAGEEISAKTIGNSMNVSTKLEVGVNPMVRTKYAALRDGLMKKREQLDKIHKMLHTLNGMDKTRLSPAKLEQLAQLTRLQFPLAGEIQRDEKELEQLQEALEVMKSGRIRVSDKAYPGVKLIIGSAMKTLQSESQHCTFIVDEAEEMIRTAPY